ncbi:MAG TPA: SDR family oxidoreductase [Acidimicrobiales bacterium]|nr:SDR family oxidoreductase [Acidimicrobiales bacterium]
MSDGDSRRVLLLTGASGGLGTWICQHWSDRYDIVAVYRRRWPAVPSQGFTPVDPLQPEAPLTTREVFAVQADLSVAGACDKVVEAALNRFGRIDVVVNNAVSSTWAPMLGSNRLLDSASTQMVMNVVVPLRLATTVARLFWQGRDDENRAANRNVINVSSIAGVNIYAWSGQSVYAASKAALNHLTGHMAEEFRPVGVRVNATAANSFPSIIPTERAAAAIRRLDEGDANGRIVIVDGEADEEVQLDPYHKPANA